MQVVVLYNAPTEDAPVSEADVLTQRDQVAQTLQSLGHHTICLGCTLDLADLREQLIQFQPDVVFNLVESLGNTDRLMVMSTLLLDALQVPYTGATTEAILDTSNKVKAKERMIQAGLPSPDWEGSDSSNENGWTNGRWILKPVWEHASFGMDDSAVVTVNDGATLQALCDARQAQLGRPHFAERFIDGREFNLSILAGEVLPPAEIDFTSFPAGRPRILGYRAKWETTAIEYRQSPRRFDFPGNDWPLLDQLSNYARCCWDLFRLTGYARVDFRVDHDGQPWVLEVNTNPCLSPDAGFAAALTQANIPYQDAIQRILEDAVSWPPRIYHRRCVTH